jgi:signal transduction histidine kinase
MSLPAPAVPPSAAALGQAAPGEVAPGQAAPRDAQTRPAKRPAGRVALFLWCWALVLLVVPTAVAVGLLIAGAATSVVWIGLGIWLFASGFLRVLTSAYRYIAGRILGERITAVYLAAPDRTVLSRLRTVVTDPARWRDAAFGFFTISLGISLSISALAAFVVFPLGYWLSPLLLRLWAAATRSIIGPTGEAALQQRIGTLVESRTESLDHSAAELRRIERDLHDGAQAHLVALGMNLGMAEELLPSDQQAAVALIADARESSRAALAELRSLVRGIHPPVLADRGLAGAIEALALEQPAHIDVDVVLDGRPPAPVESATYFAVAEALTNAAKHAAAQTIWVWLRHENGTLTALVGDDGVGGATLVPGGGLAGIERRMAAFDGTVTVASPPGGPTLVTITVPCALGSATAGESTR